MAQTVSYLRGATATSDLLNAAMLASTEPGLKKTVTFDVPTGLAKTVRVGAHIGVFGCGVALIEDSYVDIDTTAFFSLGAQAWTGTICYRLDKSMYKRPVITIEKGKLVPNSDPYLLVLGWVVYVGGNVALSKTQFTSAPTSTLLFRLPLGDRTGFLHYDVNTDSYTWEPVDFTGDHKVMVNAKDTAPGYLEDKVSENESIKLFINPVTRKLEATLKLEIPAADDKKFKSSGADTEPGFLNQKIADTPTVHLRVNSEQKLEAEFVGSIPAPDDHRVIASDADTTPGTLGEKIATTDTIQLSINAQNKLEAKFVGSFPVPVPDDHLVLGSNGDTVPGALDSKLVSKTPRFLKLAVETDAQSGEKTIGLSVTGGQPLGAAGGDLTGAFPDPVIRQVTGVPATLTASESSFSWQPAGGWAAGAGIGYGFGYVAGIRMRCWMANSQLGELQASYDDWKSVVAAPVGTSYRGSFVTASGKTVVFSDLTEALGTSPRFAGAYYTGLPGSTSKFWVFTAKSHMFAIEDVLANYHDNGSLKLENLFEIHLAGSQGDPNSLVFGNGVLVFVGNNSAMYRSSSADMNWTTKTLTTTAVSSTVTYTAPDPDITVAAGVMGGITFDGSRFITVGRDTGVLLQSLDASAWTVVPVNSVRYQDGTDMLRRSANEYVFALPMNTQPGTSPSWSNNDNVCWGGMVYAGNRFIVVNGKKAPSTVSQYWSPFLFSYDAVNWFAYRPTQDEMDTEYSYSCYKLGYGNQRVFATNSNPTQDADAEPAVYRLLIDEVPFHANLLAEKNIKVLGEVTFSKYANADYVALDADGGLVGHALPASVKVLGTDADKKIVESTVTIPKVTVSTADPSGVPADGDIWLKIAP